MVFPYLVDYNGNVGEPNIKALPEFEQRTFFETLLAKKKLNKSNERLSNNRQ